MVLLLFVLVPALSVYVWTAGGVLDLDNEGLSPDQMDVQWALLFACLVIFILPFWFLSVCPSASTRGSWT